MLLAILKREHKTDNLSYLNLVINWIWKLPPVWWWWDNFHSMSCNEVCCMSDLPWYSCSIKQLTHFTNIVSVYTKLKPHASRIWREHQSHFFFLLTVISSASIQFRIWISNYIYIKLLGAISHPCLKFNSGLAKISLTHCGLMTPYGDLDLGQHWFR